MSETFTSEFAKGYKTALIAQCKEAAEAKHADGGPELQLQPAPPAEGVILSGWATKLGDVKKNWKKRWFVALNARDNYEILYYEKEQKDEAFAVADKIPKSKGTMKLSGFKVSGVDNEPLMLTITGDVSRSGARTWTGVICTATHTRTCTRTRTRTYRTRTRARSSPVSGQDDQRPWRVKFESEAARDAWRGAYVTAASKAKPPAHKDALIRAAFLSAYQQTRSAQGLWGAWACNKAEEDMLGALLGEVVHRRVLDELYAKIPPEASVVRSMIKKTVTTTVRAAAGACWKGACSSMEAAAGTLSTTVQAALTPLLELEPKLNKQIVDAARAKIQPVIATLAKDRAKAVCDVVVSPIGRLYVDYNKNLDRRRSGNGYPGRGYTSTRLSAVVEWGGLLPPPCTAGRCRRSRRSCCTTVRLHCEPASAGHRAGSARGSQRVTGSAVGARV